MSGRLTRRTWVTLGILLLAIPALMAVFVCVWDERKYYLTSLLLVGLMFVPFVLRFEGRRPQARELVLLATMTALAVAGRAAFYWLPAVQAVCAIVILTAVAFTPEAGFVTGAAAGLISNFFFGQGPWTPWQMLGFGLVGFLGGVLFSGRKVQLVPLRSTAFSRCSSSMVCCSTRRACSMYNAAPSWQLWLATCASGFVFNLIHAGATAVFLLLLYKPLLSKLARVKEKYGLLEWKKTPHPVGCGDFFICTSCLLPEQAVIVKDDLQPAGVLPPREVGAHRTADERVLLKIHHKIKAPEQLLQHGFERLRGAAEPVMMSAISSTLSMLYCASGTMSSVTAACAGTNARARSVLTVSSVFRYAATS